MIADGEIKNAIATYGEAEDGGYLANPGKQVLLGAENSIYYFTINNTKKPLDNPLVRKAISLAINRQAICDVVFESTREPADSIIPPGIAGYQKGAWANSKYDVEAAKAALAEAGFPEGKGLPKLSITFNSDGGHEKVVELVQADLKAIGINLTADSLEWDAYLKKLQSGKYDIGRMGWVADYPIAYNFLYPLFDSKSSDNLSKYANKSVDTEIAAAEQNTDEAARLSAFDGVNKTIAEADPVAPIMFYKHHEVTSEKVHDFRFGPDHLADYSKIWLSE
jgi:peptide/nickel transport system substrate-binding protein/oligopeptide transport system substrate-binding protein